MIKKICLENFMAHKATCIEVSPGVTVITGPNNIGKSAIVEAMRYLVYNPSPKNVIRHGAKKAVVRLELDSGEAITWQRQDKYAAYLIEQPGQEPQEYHKFGRDVPEDVRTLLRLNLVATDTDEKIDIHLGNQRQPIFLLDRPGSHAAGFFAASTEADYLLKMQQALKRRTEQANRDRKRLDAELAELAQALDYFAPLDDLENLLAQAEADYAVILEDQRRLPVMTERILQVATTQAQLTGKTQVASILAHLPPPPSLQELSGLAFLLGELKDKTRLHRFESARTTHLADLTAPPVLSATVDLDVWLSDCREIFDRQAAARGSLQILSELATPPAYLETRDLAGLIQALQTNAAQHEAASRQTAALARAQEPPTLAAVTGLPGLILDLTVQVAKTGVSQRRRTAFEFLAPPPVFSEISLLGDVVAALTRETYRLSRWRNKTHFLARLRPPPETTTLSDLEDMVLSLTHCLTALASLQAQQDVCRRALDQKRAETDEYLRQTGACPLCGGRLDVEHFLEGQHG